MEHATTTEVDSEALEQAWQAYQLWTGERDVADFRATYLGSFENRAAYGEQLLMQLGAYERLARVPQWMRHYLRFDGEAVLRDFEAAGHFWVWPGGDSAGACHVFDVHARALEKAASA